MIEDLRRRLGRGIQGHYWYAYRGQNPKQLDDWIATVQAQRPNDALDVLVQAIESGRLERSAPAKRTRAERAAAYVQRKKERAIDLPKYVDDATRNLRSGKQIRYDGRSTKFNAVRDHLGNIDVAATAEKYGLWTETDDRREARFQAGDVSAWYAGFA